MSENLLDSVYGCLVGGAIGDALGAPIECWWWTDIRAKYGRLTEFVSSEDLRNTYGGKPGQVTDDTTLRQLMCLAIVRKGGRITPDDFAELWKQKLNPDRMWLNERIVLDKLRIGMNPWDTGRGTPPTGCASMCMAPIGIINAANPPQAYQDAFNIALINQDNENRDGAATLAAAVAAAFIPGITVSGLIDVMLRHSSFVIRRSLELTLDLAYRSENVDAFCEKFYARMLDWTWPLPKEGPNTWTKERFFSASSIEIVPAVAGLLHLCKGNSNQSIIEGANFGRDCDTIGAILGNITGALQGASSIRPDWIAQVEEANAEYFDELESDPKVNFYSMAERMIKALSNERAAAERRVATLESILN
jgi:ADP-ribosylglycohydrolase